MGLVPFLFGMSGRTELPGVVLNRLLCDLGMSAAGAKAMVARMRQRGQLAARRTGRGAEYRLAGVFEASFHRIRSGPDAAPSAWPGWFHALLYQVPEADRSFRDLLRRNALLVGYGQLQQGVLIALADRADDLAATLARQPASATVYRAELRLGIDDARVAAAQAWALPDVAKVLQRHCEDLTAALVDLADAADPAGGADALRAFAETVNPPMIDTLLAPNLPAELLPADWPVGRLFALIGQVHAHYGPAANQHITAMLTNMP